MRAEANLYINKYKKNKEGFHPVSIQVYFKRERKNFPLEVSMSMDDFKEPRGRRAKEDHVFFNTQLAKAHKIIKDLDENFTFEIFTARFYKQSKGRASIAQAFDDKVESLDSDQVGTKEMYDLAKKSILKFDPKAQFTTITADWLKKYEKWMQLELNNSITTVGMYLRNLRHVFNRVISEGLVPKEAYPFGKGGGLYEIPTGKNTKKAQQLDTIQGIVEFDQLTDNERKYRDLWLFIYFGNGINVKDICHLRYKNLHPGQIRFIRQKTIRTKREVEEIVIIRNEFIDEIIKRQSQPMNNKDTFLFPYLDDTMTPELMDSKVHDLVKRINKYMKRIAQELGIAGDIKTMTARHSFATILQNSDTPIPMISKMLGHSSIATTEAYLGSFENKQVRSAVSALHNFKKKD